MLKIPSDKDLSVKINDPSLAPIFAAGVKPPFVYVAANLDNMIHAKAIFENCGLFPGTDVFVTFADDLERKIPRMPDNIKLSVNDEVNMKTLGEQLSAFGYKRTSKIDSENEYSIRGDIIDIWQQNDPHPVRIMFFGSIIETIKLINIDTFAGIKSIPSFEIKPIPELVQVNEWQTVYDTLRARTKTFVLENFEGFNILSGGKRRGINELVIRTAPIANFFSALSVLIPEIIWNVNTRGKTVLVFVGSSRACEKYMDTKGISYVISSPDNFAPNTINIVRKELGVSFELVDEGLVIYSLHKPKDIVPKADSYEKEYGEFTLPEIGGLLIHEQHGLGRYLGIKKMQLADCEREYIVLQYDGGAFVYLPPDHTHELINYFGPPRRLDRI